MHWPPNTSLINSSRLSSRLCSVCAEAQHCANSPELQVPYLVHWHPVDVVGQSVLGESTTVFLAQLIIRRLRNTIGHAASEVSRCITAVTQRTASAVHIGETYTTERSKLHSCPPTWRSVQMQDSQSVLVIHSAVDQVRVKVWIIPMTPWS